MSNNNPGARAVSIASSGPAKNADIEALRAIAVGLVVLCHLGELFNAPGTRHSIFRFTDYWGGVDIFFCVSGFVITSSLLRQPAPSSFRELAGPFYIRRIFRIWPAAFLWLFVAVLAAKLANASGAFGLFRANLRDGLAAVLQVHNIYWSLCSTGQLSPCGKEVIYWSLSLEEQFYMLFPILLYFVGARRLPWLLGALILIQLPLSRDAPDMLWFIRTDAICYGVLIAIAAERGALHSVVKAVDVQPLLARWLALLLIAATAALSLFPEIRINTGLIALAAAGLMLIASCNRSVIVSRPAWLRSALLWGGSRSFGIYLVHNPCFWLTREIFYRVYRTSHLDHWIAMAVTCGALILLASEVSFRFVEAPLRAFGHALSARVVIGTRSTQTDPPNPDPAAR